VPFIFLAQPAVAAKGMQSSRRVASRWKGTKKPGMRWRTARLLHFQKKAA